MDYEHQRPMAATRRLHVGPAPLPIKQSFLRPDDVWMMSNESAWKSCDFSAATFIGNASVGNDILTPLPPGLRLGLLLAAEANNGCQANQKIRITVLEGES